MKSFYLLFSAFAATTSVGTLYAQDCSHTLSLQATSISCNGKSDGSIQLEVTGENAPFTFKWSNDSTTQHLTGLSAGRYHVEVTDVNGCVVKDSIDIVEPVPLEVASTVVPVSCGVPTGSVTLVASGGTPPYVFNTGTIANGTGIFDNLSAGDYAFTVTDQNGCKVAHQVEVPDQLPHQPGPFINPVGEVPCPTTSQFYSVPLHVIEGKVVVYHWSYAGGGVTVSTNPNAPNTVLLTFFPEAISGLLCVFESVDGCESPVTCIAIKVPLTPSTPGIINQKPFPACTGTEVTFDVTPSPKVATYEWSVDGKVEQSSPKNSYTTTFDEPGAYTIQVVAISKDGCRSTGRDKNIIVFTKPNVPPIKSDESFVCVGDQLGLSNDSTPGVWTSLDASIATVDEFGMVTGIAPGTVTITYKFTNKAGCDSTVKTEIEVKKKNKFFLDADGDGFGNSDSVINICTEPPPNYIATGGDCNDEDPAIHPGAPEPCEMDFNCDGRTTVCAQTGNAVVLSGRCINNQVSIEWELREGLQANSFVVESSADGVQWKLVGVVNRVSTDRRFRYLDTRSSITTSFYRVIATHDNGQKIYSALAPSPCTSWQPLTVWSNPVRDIVRFNIPSLMNARVSLVLYDMKGHVVKTIQTNVHRGRNLFSMHVSGLSAGLYMLKATWGDQVRIAKIIKE